MRRTGLELSSALAVASVVAAAMVAWYCGLPLRDPDGSTGPTFVRLPAIVLIALLLDIVPRAIIRASSLREVRGTIVDVTAERWQMANLRFMIVGLVGWYVTYASIRNLKGMVPFANNDLYDTQLDRLDRAMFGGHRPAVLLHDLLGTDIAAHVLSFFYIAWIVALPASLAVALVWVRRDRISSWWVTAVSLDWIMGVILNFALPTLGPIYDRPVDFGVLAHTSTTSLQQSMWTERLDVLADPVHTHTVQNIAAFASLHVAIATTACIVAHRAGMHRTIVVALRAFLAITMVATVYFGWHYVSDVIAGVLVGIVAAWVAEQFAALEENGTGDDQAEIAPKRRSRLNLAAKPGRS